MGLSVTLLIMGSLIISIWVIIEIKRLKHKLFAIFLISVILFGYLSFVFVLKGQNINLKTTEGLFKAGKIYVVWLGYVIGNIKEVTSYTIKQNWSLNESSEK